MDNDKEAIDALTRAAAAMQGLKPIAAEARGRETDVRISNSDGSAVNAGVYTILISLRRQFTAGTTLPRRRLASRSTSQSTVVPATGSMMW